VPGAHTEEQPAGRERVELLRRLWSEPAVTWSGSFRAPLEAAALEPRPVQRPHPPIWIGGGGPALLRLAAREADGVNVTLRTRADGSGPDPADVGLAPFLRKLALLREAAGARWGAFEIATSVWAVAVGSGAARTRSAFLAHHVEAMAATPHVLAGEVPAIVDELLRWRAEHAISSYVLPDEATADAFAPVVARLAGD